MYSLRLLLITLTTVIVQAQVKPFTLTCAQVRSFVDGHNDYRRKLATGHVEGQPEASNMQHMIWDDELASKAGKYAAKGNFQHNPNTSIESGRFRTGENLYMFSSTSPESGLNIDDALRAWFDEHKDYTYGKLSYADFSNHDKQVGHYTQMIWADSVYIGCGVSQKYSRGWTSHLVVCNYGPAGNIIGRTPYITGKGCEKLCCAKNNCSQLYGDHC